MYACSHCNATGPFMVYREGALLKVLEDPEDTEGLELATELLCIRCNEWFVNPTRAQTRRLSGELVTITGLKGKRTIKTVATGVTFPFSLESHEEDAVRALAGRPSRFIEDLFELNAQGDAQLAIRVKEEGDPNTWVYRLDARKVRKALRAQ